MNAAQRRDWLEASAACLGLRLRGLRGLLEELDALGGPCRWEAAFSPSSQPSLVRLRCFGEALAGDWTARAAGVFGARTLWKRTAAASLPRLSLDWDGASDRLSCVGFFGRDSAAEPSQAAFHRPGADLRRRRFEEVPFSSGIFPRKRITQEVAALHALCPVRCVRLEWEAGEGGAWRLARRWALCLKTPLAWPLFLKLDLARAFAARCGQLSLLALDRKVSEIVFEEDLWAYFG